MERKIIIKNGEGRYDTPLFTLSDNESLKITIDMHLSKDGMYRYMAQHGQEKMCIVLADKSMVELSAEWLKKGGVEPIISTLEYCDKTGTVIYKKYNIEPLNVLERGVNKEYSAAIQALEKAFEEFKEERVGDLKTFKDSIEQINNKLQQFEDDGVPVLTEK